MQTDDTYLPLDFEGECSKIIVLGTIFNPGSLRYQIFDLGTLLLGEGIPAKVFKGELSNWLYEAQRELRIYSTGEEARSDREKTTFEHFSKDQVQRFFQVVEYWVALLGRSVFSGDKLYYYRVRCNNILYAVQSDIARGLGTPYGTIEWSNGCLVQGGGVSAYTFSNTEPHAAPRRDAYAVTREE